MLCVCGTFAGCALTLPIQCCLQLGLSALQVLWWQQTRNFATNLLLPLVVPFFTRCCWTIKWMLRGGLRTLVGLSSSACAPLAILCLLMPPMFLFWMPLVLCSCYLTANHEFDLYNPRSAASAGVMSCTYHHWVFRPYRKQRRYCQLPVSGRRMQFLQFRLASHNLPVVVLRFAGAQHVNRVDSICAYCGLG